MAHLWYRERGFGWDAHALEGPAFRISGGVILVSCPPDSWALVADPDSSASVNGLPVPGIRVLRDRDEIRFRTKVEGAYSSVYFSAERRGKIEPYADPETGAPNAVCPRCRQALSPGRGSVRCPGCGVWHHEDEARGRLCWTYSDECAVCGEPTRLDGEFRWRPEEAAEAGGEASWHANV